MSIDVRLATSGDLPAAIEMLRQAGLPTTDLTAAHLALVAEREQTTLGVIGLQACGEFGLLRSLVVAPAVHGQGVGRCLVEALEQVAHERGIAELWLLTIDADPFFSSLDYRVRDRTDAPAEVRATDEFSSLCPGDAVLMSKLISTV